VVSTNAHLPPFDRFLPGKGRQVLRLHSSQDLEGTREGGREGGREL